MRLYVLHLIGPTCSGKSTLYTVLADRLPDVYLLSYDRIKWQVAGYQRDTHRKLIKELAFGFFELVCQKHISVLLDMSLTDEAEYGRATEIAKRYGYSFISVEFTAPRDVLLDRFRSRVEDAKRMGTKISVTSEDIFLNELSKRPFVPPHTPVFDTSKVGFVQFFLAFKSNIWDNKLSFLIS